jgi:hypothetical protein
METGVIEAIEALETGVIEAMETFLTEVMDHQLTCPEQVEETMMSWIRLQCNSSWLR